MKRTLVLNAFLAAAASVAANADVPAPAPSLPPYVQPAPSPVPTPPQPGAVVVPIGPNTVFGGATVPLPNCGRVDGTTVISPGNGWNVQGTVTLPHDFGGK